MKARWVEASALEDSAERALGKFLDANPSIYDITAQQRAEFLLQCHEIVSAWKNRRPDPNLETQRNRWHEAQKHARALRKALEALRNDLGDDFSVILAGRVCDESFAADAIADVQHIEKRAQSLVQNFSGKAADKRNDRFVVMALAEIWAQLTNRRATANQEKSPFYYFLLEAYEVYQLDEAPSRTTLQGWLPKQT